MPDWFAQKYADGAAELDDILRINTPAAQAHADKYNDYIQQGRRVIPVVHSQGNFYLMKLLLNKSKGISIHMFN